MHVQFRIPCLSIQARNLRQAGGPWAAYSGSYEYDRVGNLRLKAEGGITLTMQYNSDTAHVHAVSAVDGAAQVYDANGNMTVRVVGGVTYAQGWDPENRLVWASTGGVTTTFTYDANGALVKKEDPLVGTTYYVGPHYEVLVPAVILPPAPADLTACYESMGGPNVCNDLAWTGSSGVTYNIYRSSSSPVPTDAGHRIASEVTETEYTDCGRYKNYFYAVTAVDENGESAPSNEAQASEPCGSAMALTLPVLNVTALIESGGDPVVTKYFFFGGKRVAMDREGVVQYLATDHLGSTSLVMDDQGSVVAESRHYPYGEERWRWPEEGTFPTEYRFTGQRSESYIKLTVMGARWYDCQIGRWISPDIIIPAPANPQSFNRYSYVNNRPLVAIDPTGHDLMIVGGAGGNMDPIEWQQWIMEYKGWSTEEWTTFYEAWSGAADFAHKNEVLAAEGIGIFAWGGNTMEEAISNADSKRNVDMLDELANQMAGMKDVTLVGWSKGGSLVMHYLKRLEKGQIEGVRPLRAVLLAPATHPLGKYRGTGWQNNYVPESGPRTVNICSQGDIACPLTIKNASRNFNPPWEGHKHGPHGDYAGTVIRTLDVAGHHGANPDTNQDGWYIKWQYHHSR